MATTIVNLLATGLSNFKNNLAATYSNFISWAPEKYIRLIAVVGAYILLRPYIIKFGSRMQTKEHEKEVDADEMAAAAAISPNSLRGHVQVPDDSDEDEEKTTGADWGKKARKRQRQMVKRVLEAEEKLRREQEEDEEDKDIEQFLVG